MTTTTRQPYIDIDTIQGDAGPRIHRTDAGEMVDETQGTDMGEERGRGRDNRDRDRETERQITEIYGKIRRNNDHDVQILQVGYRKRIDKSNRGKTREKMDNKNWKREHNQIPQTCAR